MQPKKKRPHNSPCPIRFQVGFRTSFPTGYYGGFHQHEGIEIVYHPSGSGENHVTGLSSPLQFKPGSVVIYPPLSSHDQRMHEGGTDYGLILDLREAHGLWPDTPVVIHDLSEPYVIGELTMLSAPTSVVSENQQDALDWRGMAILMALRAESRNVNELNGDERGLRYVRDAQRYMGEHLGEPYRLRDIATRVGLSGEHLRHIFVKCEGMTIGRWLTESRIRRATDLLTHSPLPLKAIASQCGFRNESYFCTAFKKETGITPGACRQGADSIHHERYLDALRASKVTDTTYKQQFEKVNR